MALRFPVYRVTERWSLRRRVHRTYSIFYYVDADKVVIARFLHAARDYDRLLFPEN